MTIKPIDQPLPGEQVVALSPESAAEAATVWLARPNLFPGRALTAPTLQRRQRWQAGRLALRGQRLTAGVVQGLEVGYDVVPLPAGGEPDITLAIAAGRGLAVSGEDVLLPQPVEIHLRDLPVFAEPSVEAGLPPEPVPAPPPPEDVPPPPRPEETLRVGAGDTTGAPAPPDDVPPRPGDEDGGGGTGAGELRARAFLRRRLGALLAAAPNALPRVGVLVLQPITVDRLGEFDPTDPCELGFGEVGDNSSFEDWRIADGVRLAWYAWPLEWQPLPAAGPTQRNALAWTIFQAEAALPPDAVLPWEQLGVPVALIALDSLQLQPMFIDRASVVRLGGRARDPRLALGAKPSAEWRRAPLWQAQIEQLAEQIADAGDPPPPAATLAEAFARLPPAGLLPTNAIDLGVLPLNDAVETLRSDFFPDTSELDAVPVPIESLDLAVREAASLAPIDMSQAERVRVLVPVPQAVYEPRLLQEEVIDPEFQATLDRFLLARARALGARQGLRTKHSRLVQLATGRALPVPKPEEDAQALEAESYDRWGPPPADGGHRGLLAPGAHQHFFKRASAHFAIAAGDRLYVYVHLDPDHPPLMLMLQWSVDNDREHRAYWAAPGDESLLATDVDGTPQGTDGTPSRARIGDLPEAGSWQRLEVPAAVVGLGGAAVNGMAFMLYDGHAAFGPTGKVTPQGDQKWFSDTLPAGAEIDTSDPGVDPWTLLTPNDLYAPFEPPFGLEVDPDENGALGRSTIIAALKADSALAPLTVTEGNVNGGVLSPAELQQLDARGLDGFIAFLKSRADRADDIVDYGFVKVQTDTYRVRQLILGTTAATRLAISPTLATIAQSETAVASQERIASFFDELKTAPAVRAAAFGGTAPTAPPTAAVSVAGPITGAGLTRAGITTARVVQPTAISTAALDIGVTIRDEAFARAPLADRTTIIDREVEVVRPIRVVETKPPTPTPRDVTEVDPLIGKALIRTTSIAQRLEEPKALNAKNYSTATRYQAMQALLRLVDELRQEDGGTTPGLFAGLNVYGLANDPFLSDNEEPPPADIRHVAFDRFILNRGRLARLLNPPAREEADEAGHFSDTADLSDNTIALMRQVEGRIKLYRTAITVCERARDALRADIDGAAAGLTAWDGRLAEARHDVAVTRALIAEENERLAAINKRRTDVLRHGVRFLAYVRPRETRNLLATPARQLDPGLIEAPVPACLGEHADIPDQLTAMLAVLREAPAAWFVAVPKLMERLDRVDLLVRAVQSAQLRSRIFAARPLPVTVATASPVARAISLVQARQHQTVLETRQLATTVDVARLATLTWRGVQEQAQTIVSIGDLIDGEHGRGEVARRAAEAYDQMARIAACLHAEFSAVLPSIRLDWAERLSQFDVAPRLRDLAVLPRWGEIEYIDRKQMQAFVDWLFDQVDARESRADGLMNDVVRMCLLLAADAPIGRILAGRLPRPAVVRPGLRLPLTAFDPARLRIGMHALIYQGSQVLARAVVEDIGSEVAARVVHTAAAEVNLGVDVRVQFAEATQVSLARQPATVTTVRTKVL